MLPARPPAALRTAMWAGSATRLQRYAQHFGQAALQAGEHGLTHRRQGYGGQARILEEKETLIVIKIIFLYPCSSVFIRG